ncbi:hypothetical protein J1614_000962 [Plenodomus biglobosus]|nr:hypothetical protein J1614_000962 [Plenodomus biglobosus]
MADSTARKPVNPLPTRRHRASTTTGTTPNALPFIDELRPRNHEKSGKIFSKRVPPGLIVAKSFNEKGQPEVEQVFDCRKKRSTGNDTIRASANRQAKAQCGDGGVGGAISRNMQRVTSVIWSLFQRPKEP